MVEAGQRPSGRQTWSGYGVGLARVDALENAKNGLLRRKPYLGDNCEIPVGRSLLKNNTLEGGFDRFKVSTLVKFTLWSLGSATGPIGP